MKKKEASNILALFAYEISESGFKYMNEMEIKKFKEAYELAMKTLDPERWAKMKGEEE